MLHESRTLSHIPVEDLEHPVWGWDNRLLRGQNGIGTLFGYKKGEKDAPVPRVDYMLRINADGSVSSKDFSWSGQPVQSDHAKALLALYHCSYSVPHYKVITYSNEFMFEVYTTLFIIFFL